MHIEQPDLGDGGGADKSGALVELRTGLHAAAATHALGELVGLLLHDGGNPRAIAQSVGSVDGNPGFDRLQILKQHGAIHLQGRE